MQKCRPAGAPSNTTLPSISGSSSLARQLSASTGTWLAVPSPTYTYQWQHCNSSGGSCANITGATSATYLLSHSDVEDMMLGGGHRDQLRRLSQRALPRRPKSSRDLVSRNTRTTATATSKRVTDPNGNTTKYTYDADNELTKDGRTQQNRHRNGIRLDGPGQKPNRRKQTRHQIRAQPLGGGRRSSQSAAGRKRSRNTTRRATSSS